MFANTQREEPLSDEQRAEGQEPDAGEAQAATPEATQAVESSGSDDSQSMSIEEVRKLRAENASRRHREKELERQVEALTRTVSKFEDSQKTEKEREQEALARAQKAAEQAEAKAQEASLRAALAVKAGQYEIVDIDAALRLMDTGSISFADGDPDDESLTSAVEALLAERPYLKAQTPRPNAGASPNPGRSENATPTESDAQRRARLMGGGGFPSWATPEGARAHGGGVVVRD